MLKHLTSYTMQLLIHFYFPQMILIFIYTSLLKYRFLIFNRMEPDNPVVVFVREYAESPESAIDIMKTGSTIKQICFLR